ncbi:serine/threonine/tyrosine-interacting protein, variant 2 [Coprinopsis cinerea AmutBmut pab1-1]|nr:serine/threonine/tyrosine-interacting protein, variant 2 [Coprinopsis cinerea AmutBmut pab1-1]
MTHGLDYSQTLLDTLPVVAPVLESSKVPGTMPSPPHSDPDALDSITSNKGGLTNGEEKNPVRLLSPPLFASFHLNHLVSHPPDHVLFPFLHGLEGENDAQNTFFANANVVVNSAPGNEAGDASKSTLSGSHHVVNVTVPNVVHGQHHPDGSKKVDLAPSPYTVGPSNAQGTTTHQLLRPKVPQYRGLVWVVCEDDLKDDKVTLSILRRKPLPTATCDGYSSNPEDMILDDSDDDAMLTSSDDDDLDDESTTSSDSEFFGDDENFDSDDALREATSNLIHNDDCSIASPSIAQQDEERGILSSHNEDAASLGKPLTKEQMDSMPYMHPVVMPHHHQHSPQFASLPAIDTSNITVSTSTSVSSSSGSEVDSVFTSTTKTPTTGTATTSISGSPTSPSPVCSPYLPPQVVELPEATQADPIASLDRQEELKDRHVKAKARLPKIKSKRKSKTTTDPAAPPLLTCTFRPKELLRKRKLTTVRSKDGRQEVKKKHAWEFVPTRVPDGISLRNFGIQVPIYATLSDIVVYSPKGASPNAIALAHRFREAIQRKREERITALKGIVYSQVHAHTQSYKTAREGHTQSIKIQHHHITAENLESAKESSRPHGVHSDDEEDDVETRLLDAAERYLLNKVDEELLDYNVFVLDADEEQMRKRMGHLMMHSCGSGVPGVEKPQSSKSDTEAGPTEVTTGAHTVGNDGRLAAESRMDTDLVVGEIEIDDDGDVAMSDSIEIPADATTDTAGADTDLDISDFDEPIPNTVDFALREREEMRDLTKASEIISLFPVSPSENNTPTKATFGKGLLYDSPLSSTPSGTPVSGSQPPHLQHLSNLVPPPLSSPHLGGSPTSPEFTYNHPNPSVDISSLSKFYDPRVGQVFLGNSSDVPLVPEPPSEEAQQSARNRLEDVNADELAADDPFNPSVTNNPAKGFGYDICIECHELAPFPTAAHLRAAEDHLVTLERVWRERMVRREVAKLQAEVENVEANPEDGAEDRGPRTETKTLRIPPRPAPHANAIIHLPFPSSPPNNQSTLAQLIPVLRFLERWIRPVNEVTVDVQVEVTPAPPPAQPTPPPGDQDPEGRSNETSSPVSGVRRWSSSVVSSILPAVFGGSNPAPTPPPSATVQASPSPPPSSSRLRSNTSPAPTSHVNPFHQTPQGSSFGYAQPAHQQHTTSYQQYPRHQTPVQSHRMTPTRPLKILIYSADGYTESSLPSLCLLMSVKGLTLPEAYLELQVAKRRSFFVYQHDLGILRKVEGRLREERERERERLREAERQRELREIQIAAQRERERAERERNERDRDSNAVPGNGNGKRSLGSSFFRGLGMGPSSSSSPPPSAPAIPDAPATGERRTKMGRPAAKSVSFAQVPGLHLANPSNTVTAKAPGPTPSSIPGLGMGAHTPGHASEYAKMGHASTLPASSTLSSQSPPVAGGGRLQLATTGRTHTTTVGRPRANTSPWLPSVAGDHQSWFNDPRFDGSFPSRVLPFLYLGNLNHASNVYMLHALGITHVVSVGECALLPPPFHMIGQGSAGNAANASCSTRAYKQSYPNTSGHGSLFIEEREGRIKVLDIKGVCDDGIDTLEPQLEPICDWIDKARAEGGQVLVHCRVGVSRSATVTVSLVFPSSLPVSFSSWEAKFVIDGRMMSTGRERRKQPGSENFSGWKNRGNAEIPTRWTVISCEEPKSRPRITCSFASVSLANDIVRIYRGPLLCSFVLRRTWC